MVVANVAAVPPEVGLAMRLPSFDDGIASLRCARETFLETGETPFDVRPEIAASWRRSALCGVSAPDAVPNYAPGVNFDCQLVRVARPVLEHREAALASTRCAIVLTDSDACVLARWGSDAGLEFEMTARNVLPSFCFSEAVVGTNSAALALELGRPAEVRGAEHLSEEFIDFSSAGAPITHPVSRRVLGTLNVTCRVEDTTPLLMAWLLEVTAEIERRLRTEGCVREQLLLESFLKAKRDSRHPVLCLNDQTVLSNSAAARLLGTVDKALLWEQASRAISESANDVSTFVLSDGQRVSAACHPIYDGLTAIGAKIEIQLSAERDSRPSRKPAEGGSRGLAPLAGQGERWQTLCEDATNAKERGDRILFVGAPGTGKMAIAEALFADEKVDAFDGALVAAAEVGVWVRQLRARLESPGGVVLLRHLEALDALTARIVASLLDRVGSDGPRIVATLNRGEGAADAADVPMHSFTAIVSVPPVRDRLEDLLDLLQALTARHATGDGVWRWMPDAIQTLSRIEHPNNVRSLESVVMQVVAGRAPGYIDARALPTSVRAAGSRRRLSRLEQLEAAAITESLQRSAGNKLEAARSLGIARSTLYRRMRTLGIDLTEANF